MLDGASRACRYRRYEKEENNDKRRRNKIKTQKERRRASQFQSDATCYAIWSGKQDRHKYVCVPAERERLSLRVGVGWKWGTNQLFGRVGNGS